MNDRVPILIAATILLGSGVLVAAQDRAPRSGQEVFDSTCVGCHGTGKDGAPKIGDPKAWEPRAKQGLASLTANAVDGIRKMPPHGGRLDLSDLELQRGITYIVNHSGGRWAEPIDRRNLPKARAADEIVRSRCATCHESGRDGAPRLGDRDAWIGRARQGMDGLVASAVHGHGGMPARGGMAELSDAEMRGAVNYMVQWSLKQPQPK